MAGRKPVAAAKGADLHQPTRRFLKRGELTSVGGDS